MNSPDSLDSMAALEFELKKLVIEVAALEDVTPEEIGSQDPLFADGLGLDSIDALEVAVALDQRYGVETREDDVENAQHFATIRSLATFVAAQRAR
jgi:acyl carrier protein